MNGGRIKYKKAGNKFLFFLLFVFITFNSVSNCYSLDIPCPPNTELAEEGTHQYRSLLTQYKILKFYRQKLTREGWRQVDAPLQQASGFNSLNRTFNFVKGSDTLTLTFSPFTAEGFVFYTIDVESPPGVGDLAEGENPSLDDAFKEPEPLDFMPIYPGSKQVDYRKLSSGIQAGYMASGGIGAVKGFYLQKMPQQGWSLIDEKRIGGDQYDLSNIENDCPTCPKLPPDTKEMVADMNMQGVLLEFKQGGKACMVNITEMGGFEGADLTSVGLGDTIITVLYNDKK